MSFYIVFVECSLFTNKMQTGRLNSVTKKACVADVNITHLLLNYIAISWPAFQYGSVL